MFCLQETLNGNQNNWIWSFLIEILLHIYNVHQTKVISDFFSLLLLTNYENIESEFLLYPNTQLKFLLTIMMSQL